MGFDQLDAWFTLGIVGFVDEVFAVDVDAPADERLAFLEGKSSGAGDRFCRIASGFSLVWRSESIASQFPN
ncbi:MAG: hypothetical protein QE267_07280 [Akkermansiaceae bacterium]|nr:hypothetical protein [Akkermansiaceae bacterium]